MSAQGSVRLGCGALVAVVAVAAVVAIAGLAAAWWRWDPRNRDVHELDRLGAPRHTVGRVGRDWDSNGTAVCIDSCLEMSRQYAATRGLALTTALADARSLLSSGGYAVHEPVLCELSLPDAVALSCSVEGERRGSVVRVSLDASVPAGSLPTSGGNQLTVDQVPADAAVTEPIRIGATVH